MLFAKSVPQQTIPVSTEESVIDLIKKLVARNQELTEQIAQGDEAKEKRPVQNDVGRELLIKMLGGE